MQKFAFIASLALFSIPALADQITLSASSGGGINDLGLFDFSAFGEVNVPFAHYPQHTPPTTVSYTWSQAFVLPPSPAGDYLEVTRVNTYSTGGDIIIDGQVYGNDDNLDFVGRLFPDPNMYKEAQGPYGYHATTPMDLFGPVFVYVYGDFTRAYGGEDCCVGSVNAYGFEQFLQIERFHADGAPDPFPFAPEPASFGLVGLALLPVGWMIRRRSPTR